MIERPAVGARRGMAAGLLCYATYMAANLYPTWSTLMPTAVILGLGAGTVWVGQASFVTRQAERYAASDGVPIAEAVGRFNSFFYAAFMTTQVFGNLVGVGVLAAAGACVGSSGGQTDPGTVRILFCVFLALVLAGGGGLLLLSDDAGGSGDTKAKAKATEANALLAAVDGGAPEPRRAEPDEADGAFLLSDDGDVAGTVIVIPPPVGWLGLGDARLVALLPLIAFFGIEQSFSAGAFTAHVVKPALGECWVGGVMACYGAADVLAALVMGRIVKGTRSCGLGFFMGAALNCAAMVALLLRPSYGDSAADLTAVLAIAAALGAGDGVWNAGLSSWIGFVFSAKHATGPFGVWKSFSAAGTAAFFFINASGVELSSMLWIMMGVLAAAVASFPVAYRAARGSGAPL